MKSASTARRILVYGFLTFALFVAILYRMTVPLVRKDPLRGDSDDAKNALQTLLKTAPADQREGLLRQYVNDASPNLRLNALQALGELYPQSSQDLVQNALADNSAPIREWGLEAAHRLERPKAMRLLLTGLQDTDTQVKASALQELKALLATEERPDDKSAVPVLVQELAKAPALLRPGFTRILAKLTGNHWDLTTSASLQQQNETLKKWADWWKSAEPSWEKKPYGVAAAQTPTRSDVAPDFSATDVEGVPFRLADQRGRVVMLNFWGTWCNPCRAELPDLQKLFLSMRGKPFDLIGLALNEEGEEKGLKERSQKLGVSYRQALCSRQVQHDYGEVTGVPVTYLIDKRGLIRYRWEGAHDYATFSSAVERLLKE